MPWLYHGIFATVFGALTSFLQSGGRLLRAHPSLDHVIVQDHGGSWWRHGSLNADRHWSLEWDNHIATGLRENAIREKREPEPILCPKCHRPRLVKRGMDNLLCPHCGFRASKKSRPVIQADGALKEMAGDILKPHRVKCLPNTQTLWDSYYYRAKRSRTEMTFNQARALFFIEHHYYPPKTLANMPVDALGWFRKVKNVSREDLTRSDHGMLQASG
jgi:hypothetical protein